MGFRKNNPALRDPSLSFLPVLVFLVSDKEGVKAHLRSKGNDGNDWEEDVDQVKTCQAQAQFIMDATCSDDIACLDRDDWVSLLKVMSVDVPDQRNEEFHKAQFC